MTDNYSKFQDFPEATMEEIRKFTAPRQVVKTRWLRITWNRSKFRGPFLSLRLWLPRAPRRNFRFQLDLNVVTIVIDPIPKDRWIPEKRWFWLPLAD